MYTPEMKAKIGLTATATDADVDAKLEQMQAAAAKLPDLETKLASEKEARITAETARLTAEATAQVETWQREGRISGNATAAVKEFYVGLMTADGKAITPEKFASVMAALPKVSTERIAETAKTTEEPEAKPTKADFHAYDKGDKTAAAKIDSFVKQIAAKDKSKKYAQHMQAVRAEALAAK